MILENPKTINKTEAIAHYEGDYTNLLKERITHPIVRQRLIDNLYEHASTLPLSDYEWAGTYERTPRQAEQAKKSITKEKIAGHLDSFIENVFDRTGISYAENAHQPASGGLNRPGTMFLAGLWKEVMGPLSVKQMNMTESHEKGHGIRMFYGDSDVTKKVQDSVDFSNIPSQTKKDYLDFIYDMKDKANISHTGEINEQAIVDYFNDPNEIIERMSQLKNYFGMRGIEVFTKEHLDYAKKHYIDDMGIPIQMQAFFDAITPEKEGKFIELMNTLGI